MPEHAYTLGTFRGLVASCRVPTIGGGAGTGLSAKCKEAGGIDLIIIDNSGRYRIVLRVCSDYARCFWNPLEGYEG